MVIFVNKFDITRRFLDCLLTILRGKRKRCAKVFNLYRTIVSDNKNFHLCVYEREVFLFKNCTTLFQIKKSLYTRHWFIPTFESSEGISYLNLQMRILAYPCLDVKDIVQKNVCFKSVFCLKIADPAVLLSGASLTGILSLAQMWQVHISATVFQLRLKNCKIILRDKLATLTCFASFLIFPSFSCFESMVKMLWFCSYWSKLISIYLQIISFFVS